MNAHALDTYYYRISLRERFDNLHPEHQAAVLADCFTELLLQDVDFVRIVGDEVVRIETMKVGGQKIVRTEKEVILEKPDKDTEAKQGDRPPNAPSLRRPGEDSDNAPKPADGISPVPISPPDAPQPSGNPGPGDMVAGHS